MKLEISGTNSNANEAFFSRIHRKRKKFKERKYEPPADEELLGIVDFYFDRYLLWSLDHNV